MSAIIVCDGDGLQFSPTFGNRTVVAVGNPTIGGTGYAVVAGHKVCIVGDEGNVKVPATYTTPSHTVAGMGEIRIKELAEGQKVPDCISGAALIVKGMKFIAEFVPTTPAQSPPPASSPDATEATPGTGEFVTRQAFATARR